MVTTIDELCIDWLEEWIPRIQQEIHDLHHRREIHDGMMEMLDRAGDADTGVFRAAFHRMYLESQLTAIRRQADTDSRTISLRRLIGQLNHHRSEFTRDWFVDRWLAGFGEGRDETRNQIEINMHTEMANLAFDKFADDGSPNRLGGRALAADLERLSSATSAVSRYVDTQVAHSDRSAPPVETTYDEFHASMDELGALLQRYHLLITQNSLVSAKPTIQADWRRPFRSALCA